MYTCNIAISLSKYKLLVNLTQVDLMCTYGHVIDKSMMK